VARAGPNWFKKGGAATVIPSRRPGCHHGDES
jgi:hypothetical protein